jgi:hypothetical protein
LMPRDADSSGEEQDTRSAELRGRASHPPRVFRAPSALALHRHLNLLRWNQLLGTAMLPHMARQLVSRK